MEFHHISVMPEETVSGLVTSRDGIYVDCTLGGAGHSRLIADMLTAEGRLVGIDQDTAAIETARERLADCRCRVDIVKSNFSRLENVLAELGVDKVDGVLFDLGVSSHQLDTADRGFSYMQDAPLDMRMNQQAEFSAYDVVNGYDADELNRIFREYGEERWSKRIAEFIVAARRKKPVETTGELVDIIKRAVPAAVRNAKGGHPAKRIFQAVRIEVNDELGILEKSFRAAVAHLKPGGRIAIITFHSLEDRIVKTCFKQAENPCTCPPGFPVCVCNKKPKGYVVTRKPIIPTQEEMEQNSRSKSAKLRIFEKVSEGNL